jgi:hypothetical protein
MSFVTFWAIFSKTRLVTLAGMGFVKQSAWQVLDRIDPGLNPACVCASY